jgi:hypothetical protein
MFKKPFWLILALLASSSCFADNLIDYGSSWKYFAGTTEASPDRTSWRMKSFNDADWLEGATPLGYSTSPNNPAESSILTSLPSSAAGNYLSVFLRHAFVVRSPAAVGELTLNINIDDGVIAWVNGHEIGRYNMPSGEPRYDSTATSAIEPRIVTLSLSTDAAQYLLPGTNLLALQVFNANSSSSDLLVDAALASDLDETAPLQVDTSPTPGATVAGLTSVEIGFSESVANVTASDLLVNGVPAADVKSVSPRDYIFNFEQPANGAVQMAWAAGQQISDLAPIPNHFAGGEWSYTLDTNLPPEQVIISEFLADNDTGLRDEDADRSDWIELYNSGSEPVNLEGWFLTDDAGDLAKWRFPSVTLDIGHYLLVWASGKDRRDPGGALHTNFKLSKDGSYLALVNAATNVVFDYSPAYPAQQEDISYGADVVSPDLRGYFNKPTPGGANVTSGPGFAPAPVFSFEGGVYTNNSLQIAITASSGQIRYTLDGTVPSGSSTLYSGPLTLTTSTTIKARVFQNGLLPGTLVAKSYFFIDNTLAGFASELPLMIFSTSGRQIVQSAGPGEARTFASLAAVDTFRGRSSPVGSVDYLGQCELEVRGQTSSGFPKQPYNLELQDAARNDRNSELLGLPSGSDWALNNPYSDKPFLQNFLAFELHEKMGHYAVRRRFVEVFMNTSGGRISYPRDYGGVYLLQEKIKIDNNRVEIAKLTPNDNTLPNISGGYIFKKDKDSPGDLNFSTQGGAGFSGQNLKIHEPKPREITSQQLAWLTSYLNQMERALYAPNWKTATGTNHYSYYLDVDSFVDYFWIVEFAKQIDGYRLSNYMQKDRGGKVKMEPIWDWNLSFGNANYATGDDYTGWYYSVTSANDQIWLRRLMCGTTSADGTSGDPDFNQRIADRWSELRTNVFALSNVLGRIDEMASLLNNAAARDFQRWPRLGIYVWPNPNYYVTPTTYAGIIAAMKTWISGRYNWIASQFLQSPSFATAPGRVPRNFKLQLQGNGSIFYTVDGSDPRLSGGARSSKAILYTGPISIPYNLRVMARIQSGSKWSGPIAGNYLVEKSPLRISEIMYHPAPPPEGSLWSEDDFEFLELLNTNDAAITLAGYRFSEGIDYSFGDYMLAAGARAVLVKNRAAFESRYGTNLPVIGEYIGSLDNSGERLTLLGALGETILDFSYHDGWQPLTDGAGFSLVARAGSNDFNDDTGWIAGSIQGGTPGSPEVEADVIPTVVINELLPRDGTSESAAVELSNLSAEAADIGGWFMTDNFQKPQKYRIPAGTVIPAGGYYVLNTSAFTNAPGALDKFSLSELGEEIYLFSADLSGKLTGYSHGFKFGPQFRDVSFGREVDSAGREHFVTQSAITLGATNTGPAQPQVVVSEIMYRPRDIFLNAAYWNDSEDEFIELYNRTGEPVPLFDPNHPTNTWKIAGDVDFALPENTSVPAGGYLLLVNFDPANDPAQLAQFRQKYGIGAAARIFGPYKDSLPNGSGKISLLAPDQPIASGSNAGKTPFATIETVGYSDQSPWNAAADGTGFSLSRVNADAFGDDPASWIAAAPSANAQTTAGLLPQITTEPLGALATSPQDVTLFVAAVGGSVPAQLSYQWRLNGKDLPGATSATLTINNAQPEQSGNYSVLVSNENGAVSSREARVLIGRDQDQDGIDDDWELDFGLNPYLAGDASVDLDQDGFSNAQEYLAGTNPADAGSYLALGNVSKAGGNTEIQFRTRANRTYSIEYTDSLEAAQWQLLTNIEGSAQDTEIAVPDPSSQAHRYYRLVTPAR